MYRALECFAVCGVLSLVGCGGTSAVDTAVKDQQPAVTEATQAASITPIESKPAVHVPADAPPDHVVTVFLEALKGGDKATTASLLTTKALEETTRHNFVVDPQSSPNMQFEVQPPEFIPNNPSGAHVTSVWTETFDDGKVTYDVVWVLRRQPEGWRIAGMAIELSEGQPLSFLNFENPEDMAAKFNEAMASQQEPAAETAAKPQDPQPIQANPTDR
jgi:hypothetical protein